MNSETMLEAVTEDAATFAATILYRDLADMEVDVLEHDGSVVLVSQNKTGRHDIWRALYECATNPNTDVLFVTPHIPSACGNTMLITDEIDRSPCSVDSFGIERTTDYEVDLDNGSRIVSRHINESSDIDRLRGHKPDLLVVDNWVEEGFSIPQDAIESVLIPMLTDEASIWINDVKVRNRCDLTQFALERGAYVKHMDR